MADPERGSEEARNNTDRWGYGIDGDDDDDDDDDDDVIKPV